ncbi:MAG: serine hydrolase [Pseudomonadota bacterium]
MTAVQNPNDTSLAVIFKDPTGKTLNLTFYRHNDPRFRKFDVARLRPDGAIISEYEYHPPQKTSNGLPVSTLAKEGIDKDKIENTVETIMVGNKVARPGFLLIARNGNLVLEEYFHGVEPNRLWHQYSISKSITSLLAGIAEKQGKIDLSASINPYFPDYESSTWMTSEGGAAGVMPRVLLRMGNVLGWGDGHRDKRYSGNQESIYEETGWIDNTFGQTVVSNAPGPYFNYNTNLINLVGFTLQRATGMHLSEYLQQALLTPLGEPRSYFDSYAAVYGGKSNKDAPVLAGSTVLMRPMAMVKIGQLLLNKGQWNGKQIVPEDWIIEATSVKSLIFNVDRFAYGYGWVITKSETEKGRAIWSILGSGIGGQFIYVVPRYNLVVAMGATDFELNNVSFFDFFREQFLPAIDDKCEFERVYIDAKDFGKQTIK